ncbi:hypothetical protein MTO96_034376 [Rhipicephalus appendiculatus]
MRSNVPSSTPEEYFRRCVFLPFLEAFTEQVDERFVKHRSILAQFEVLPSSLSLLPSKDDENAMRILCESYHSDVGDSVSSAVGELHLWYRKTPNGSSGIPGVLSGWYFSCDPKTSSNYGYSPSNDFYK